MPTNAAGRQLPDHIEGYGPVTPYAGAFATQPPTGRTIPAPAGMVRPGDDKLRPTLAGALRDAGLTDGMTVSFHHHLRNGDQVMNMTMQTIADMGIGHITIAPTILFDVHKPLIDLARRGVIRTVIGCMTGSIGRFASEGGLSDVAVLRSHGARARAVAMGDLPIDITVIASPCADEQGNATGVRGPNACGPLSFSHADARFAKKVIVVTDHLAPFPATPISISQNHVDYVVPVDSIGDAAGIRSGITELAQSEQRLRIARYAADVFWHSGLIRKGFNFQAGAGGTSLAAVQFVGQIMRDRGIKAAWVNGGIHEHVLDLFHEGLIGSLINCQAFDLPAVESLRDDGAHIETSIDQYANPHNKGCVCHQLDAIFLGATEVDVDFNVNVNTHSDGYLLHAIGGHQDTAAGAKLTIVTAPVSRKTHPIVMDRVTTVTTPGQTVDVVVTDAGIAVNPRPRNGELLERLKSADLPLVSIEQLRDESYRRAGCGNPKPNVTDRIVGVLEWRDGTVLDVIRQVQPGYDATL